jgi:hypothetical protein
MQLKMRCQRGQAVTAVWIGSNVSDRHSASSGLSVELNISTSFLGVVRLPYNQGKHMSEFPVSMIINAGQIHHHPNATLGPFSPVPPPRPLYPAQSPGNIPTSPRPSKMADTSIDSISPTDDLITSSAAVQTISDHDVPRSVPAFPSIAFSPRF